MLAILKLAFMTCHFLCSFTVIWSLQALNDLKSNIFSLFLGKCAHCLSPFLLVAPPVFTQKPSPIGALKGSDVVFQCEISGTPPFEVVWVKDRKQVRSSKKFKITSKNFDASLHILNLEAVDVGEYYCKATNEVGSDTCVCTLKFKGLYPWAPKYMPLAFIFSCLTSNVFGCDSHLSSLTSNFFH